MKFIPIDLKPYLVKAQKYTEKEIFGICLFGSQNYGLGDEMSDIDVYCLVLPNLEFSELMQQQEVLLENDERIEYIDIREFLLSLVAGNLKSLELLTTPFYIIKDQYKDVWEKLRSRANDIAYAHPEETFFGIKQHITQNFLRFFVQNANETDLKKYGYAPKQASHVMRGYEMLQKYNKMVDIYQLFYTDMREFLLAIKRGQHSEAFVISIVRDYAKKIDAIELQLPSDDKRKLEVKEFIFSLTKEILERRGNNNAQ